MAIKRLQHLRGNIAQVANTPLRDAEIFIDTTAHKAYVGDTGVAPNGYFELANASDLTTLRNDVDGNTQDIADIMSDYAKTSAGGNVIDANAVAVSDAAGKLKGVTGTNGQIISFDANGVPVAVTPAASASSFNKSAAFTMPVNINSPATVAIAGLPANCDPFMIVPEYTEWSAQPRNFNRVRAVTSNAGSLTVHHVGGIDTAIPCRIYWTQN